MLEYDEIVIGSSLDAFLFAFKKGIPVFFTKPQIPKKFDFLSPNEEYSLLGIPAVKTKLTDGNKTTFVGNRKDLLWSNLHFILSLSGLIPLSGLCETIRCDKNELITMNSYSKMVRIKFAICYYFGDDNVIDLLSIKKENTRYIIYDWFDFNKGGKHKIDFLDNDDDFCRKTWFFTTDRNRIARSIRDCCVISYVTKEQINDFDYSETMSKFYLKKQIKNRVNPQKIDISLKEREIVKYKLPTFYDREDVIVKPTTELPLTASIEKYRIYLRHLNEKPFSGNRTISKL